MTGTASHPRHDFDEHLNAPVRLSILAALVKVDEAEFQLVRDAVEVTDSVLSRQIGVLEAEGYVRVRKGYIGKRPRTWLAATSTGRTALQRHLSALRALVGEL